MRPIVGRICEALRLENRAYGLTIGKETMFKKKTKTRRPRKPSWLVARGALVLAALFFAAFTVVFWGMSLAESSIALAIFVSVGFAVSALVTPSVVPKLFHAKGFTLGGLFVTCLAFGAVDSVGLTLVFSAVEKQMTAPAYESAVDAYNAELTPLQTALTTATTARDAVQLETKFPNGEPYGPQRMAESKEAYALQRSKLQKVVDDVEAKIEAVAEPVRAKIFNLTAVALLSTALQVALALGMVALEAARERVHADALAEYRDGLDAAKADREAKAKAKAKAQAIASKKAADIAKLRAKNGLRLAVDNEA